MTSRSVYLRSQYFNTDKVTDVATWSKNTKGKFYNNFLLILIASG